MKISKYEILQKVIELGSLSKTADYCNYSQSAVSQIIMSLENELGLTILNRSHAGVTLTSDGAQLLPYIQEVSAAHKRLADKTSEILGIESGYIRVATLNSIACHLLPSILKGFKAQYPNIQLELLQGDYLEVETWISNGTVDFGFVDYPTRKEFHTTPILSDQMMALLPIGHPLASAEKIRLSQFAKEPVILLQEGKQREVLAAFRKNKVKPRLEYFAEDDYIVMALVEAGLGISILPELVLKRTPYNIVIKETLPAFRRSIALAVKKAAPVTIAAKRLMDYITAHLSA